MLSNDPDDDPFTFTVEGFGLGSGPSLEVRGGAYVGLLRNVSAEYRGVFGNRLKLTVDDLECDPSEERPITSGDTTPSTLDGTDLEEIWAGYDTIRPAGPREYPPESPDHHFRLLNTGDEALFITGVSFTGAPLTLAHSEWAPPITGQCIPPGGCATLPLNFTDPQVGENSATVNITSNDPDNPLFTFGITAEGDFGLTEPRIEVRGPDGRTLRSRGETIDLGTVGFAGTSNIATMRLENLGGEPLEVTSITSDSNHHTVDSPTVDDCIEFDIIFTPTTTGELNGTISIVSNSTQDATFTFGVTGVAQGSGGTPPDPAPELVVFGGDTMVRLLRDDYEPNTVDGTEAGTFEVGSPISFAFRSRNRGDEPLTIDRAFAAGTPTSSTTFSQLSNP